MNFNGLSHINIELCSECNKSCYMCGRREREAKGFKQDSGYMNTDTLCKIIEQIPERITVSLHNNGEPLLYPNLFLALKLFKFKNCFTTLTTNGKLLCYKFDTLVDNIDSISISIFENDPEAEEQLSILKEFLFKKKENLPFVILRFIGNVNIDKYKELIETYNLIIVKRALHLPKGSLKYKSKEVMKPEYGVCLDFLSHLAIDRFGNVSTCVRFDPEGELILGNINKSSLLELWNSKKRREMYKLHTSGRRNEIAYCGNKCEYWGVASC